MNKSRGKNVEHSKKLGQFDRAAFITSGEQLFDRKLEETFAYAKTQKNGNLKERIAFLDERRRQQEQHNSKEKTSGQKTNPHREQHTQSLNKETAKTYLPEQQPTIRPPELCKSCANKKALRVFIP